MSDNLILNIKIYHLLHLFRHFLTKQNLMKNIVKYANFYQDFIKIIIHNINHQLIYENISFMYIYI